MQGWLDASFWQEIVRDTVAWLITTLPSLLVIVVVAVLGLRAVGFALRRLKSVIAARWQGRGGESYREAEKRVETLVGVLRTVLRVIVWAMIGMVLLRKLGIDIAPLVAGAGIAGLAVGFGAQELVRDIIAGFLMLVEDQIRVGDVVIINGTGGLVERIGLRTIVLRDLSGVVHIFQNGKINTLSNMTKEWSAMVFDMGVAYKEDVDRVAAVMRETAEGLRQDPAFAAKILAPMEVFGLDAFVESSVSVKARIKTVPGAQWEVGREFRRRLKRSFDEQGIEIPFPHRTLYWGGKQMPGQGGAAPGMSPDTAPGRTGAA